MHVLLHVELGPGFRRRRLRGGNSTSPQPPAFRWHGQGECVSHLAGRHLFVWHNHLRHLVDDGGRGGRRGSMGDARWGIPVLRSCVVITVVLGGAEWYPYYPYYPDYPYYQDVQLDRAA